MEIFGYHPELGKWTEIGKINNRKISKIGMIGKIGLFYRIFSMSVVEV